MNAKLLRRIAQPVVVAIIVMFSLACLVTHTVIEQARRPREQFMSIVAVTRAAVVDDDRVYLELKVRPSRRGASDLAVLELRFGDSNWDPRVAYPYPVQAGSMRVGHVPASILQNPDAFPPTAQPLEVHHETLADPARLAEFSECLSPGYHVVVLARDPEWVTMLDEDNVIRGKAPGGPIVAIMTVGDNIQETEPFLIPDFWEGTTTNPAWYLLLPLAIPADVLTGPIQLFLCAGSGCG